MTANPGKKSKTDFQTAGSKKSLPKNHIAPKNSTQKNSVPKGNLRPDSTQKQAKLESNRGPAWKFGTAKQGRKAAAERWQRALNSASLRKRAVVDHKEPLPEVTEEDLLVNPLSSRAKKKSAFHLGFDRERSSWHNVPSSNRDNPGEYYTFEGRNVIRGTTSVEAGKDLNINLGPELILKDQKARENLNNSNQPDSALGLGMQFRLGF